MNAFEINNIVILSDFDGTIITSSVGEAIFKKFVQEDWEKYDREYEQGKITLEECMRIQYGMIKESKKVLLDFSRAIMQSRPKFSDLVNYCKSKGIQLIIVSASLDFVIEEFLRINDIRNIPIVCARSLFKDGTIMLTFDAMKDLSIRDFKEDTVKYYQNLGKQVCFIGDGTSDMLAVEQADYVFAVQNSKLSAICNKKNIAYKEFLYFTEIIDFLEARN